MDQFHHCSKTKTVVAEELLKSGTAARIESAVRASSELAPGYCEAASAIHLVYKSLKYDQYFETQVSSHAPLHTGPSSRRRLVARYVNTSERLHSYRRKFDVVAAIEPQIPATGAAAAKNADDASANDSPIPTADKNSKGMTRSSSKEDMSGGFGANTEQGEIWDVRESEAVLAVLVPPQYEVYASFHVFTTAAQAMACVSRFATWVRNSRNEFFMTKNHHW